MAARLPLIVHFVRWAAEDPTLQTVGAVDRASVEAGVALVRWFAHEARRVYGMLAESDDDRDRRRLVDLIRANGGSVSYGQFLRWRGMLDVQPPNRPEPARASSSAAARREDWKYGFVGSRGEASGTLHLPPARVSMDPDDAIDAMVPAAMADVAATVVTYTVDRLVYSVSPPVVSASTWTNRAPSGDHWTFP